MMKYNEGKWRNGLGEIMEVQFSDKDFAKITCFVESGAVDQVGPGDLGDAFAVEQPVNSQRGFRSRVANGEELPSQGETWLAGHGCHWTPMRVSMQVAQVKKVLASGNRAVFDDDDDGSCIGNPATCTKTMLNKRGRVDSFELYVKKRQKEQDTAIGKGSEGDTNMNELSAQITACMHLIEETMHKRRAGFIRQGAW